MTANLREPKRELLDKILIILEKYHGDHTKDELWLIFHKLSLKQLIILSDTFLGIKNQAGKII